jgi:hypothetical protein
MLLLESLDRAPLLKYSYVIAAISMKPMITRLRTELSLL